jgi:small subunit ribosomal protein S19|tara:strand:- start:179 stop:433 length:255 start_codon:yes stop_codon:yes gene_type:complete
MSRSVWKGPFINVSFIKKINSTKSIVETRARNCVLLPQFVGKSISVYNGKKYTRISVTEDMIGHKLGEFVVTRLRTKHKEKKKK